MKLSEKVEAMLRQTQVCVLATVGPADWPHAIPMWYRYRDGVITITTSSRSQKYKNVERNRKAMVVLDSRDPPYYAVMIKCRAEVGPGLTREEEYEIALRYLGEEHVDKFMASYDAGDHDDSTLVLEPVKVIEFSGAY